MDHIILEPYQNNWPFHFEQAKYLLQQAFNSLEIDFYHIGSTFISGCLAKPIIDILGVTADITLIDQFNQGLEQIGFIAMGEYGMEQRRYFRKRQNYPINLHIFEDSDPEVERHMRFSHFMKHHPELVEQYSALKKNLATKFPNDIDQYCLGKEAFIKSIDMRAAHEAIKPLLKRKMTKRKKSWSQAEIRKAMEVNMHLNMTFFAKYLPEVKQIFDKEVIIIQTDIQDDTFNFVIASHFNEKNVEKKIAEITHLYKEKNLPFSWWVSERDTPKNLAEKLLQQGFTKKEENKGMYLFLKDFTPQPSSISIQRVLSLKQLDDFTSVLIRLGFPEIFDNLLKKLPSILYKDEVSFQMYVGYCNKRPVTTGILILHANVAGIYFVTTDPNERKKGHATAMMNHLLKQACEKNYYLSTLQASEQGLSLYKRLGFKEMGSLTEYY